MQFTFEKLLLFNFCRFQQIQLKYVEIKCQLDATEVFIADLIACSTCFGHHYAHHQELKSIIQWLFPVVFRAVVFKLMVWCGAEDCVSGLQDVAVSCKYVPYGCGCGMFVCRRFVRRLALDLSFLITI